MGNLKSKCGILVSTVKETEEKKEEKEEKKEEKEEKKGEEKEEKREEGPRKKRAFDPFYPDRLPLVNGVFIPQVIPGDRRYRLTLGQYQQYITTNHPGAHLGHLICQVIYCEDCGWHHSIDQRTLYETVNGYFVRECENCIKANPQNRSEINTDKISKEKFDELNPQDIFDNQTYNALEELACQVWIIKCNNCYRRYHATSMYCNFILGNNMLFVCQDCLPHDEGKREEGVGEGEGGEEEKGAV